MTDHKTRRKKIITGTKLPKQSLLITQAIKFWAYTSDSLSLRLVVWWVAQIPASFQMRTKNWTGLELFRNLSRLTSPGRRLGQDRGGWLDFHAFVFRELALLLVILVWLRSPPPRVDLIPAHCDRPIDQVEFVVKTTSIANHFTLGIASPNCCRLGSAVWTCYVTPFCCCR